MKKYTMGLASKTTDREAYLKFKKETPELAELSESGHAEIIEHVIETFKKYSHKAGQACEVLGGSEEATRFFFDSIITTFGNAPAMILQELDKGTFNIP